MRVLHVIPSVAACRGGPSKAVTEMVCALNINGLNAEIVTTNDACEAKLDVELGSLVEYNGAPTRFFNRLSSPVKGLREFQFSRDFVTWLKANIQLYDVVHVHAIFSFCSSYCMWLARKRDIPYILRPIGQLETWSLRQAARKKKFYLNLFERKNIQGAAKVHFTADSEHIQAIEQFPELDSIIIPLGIHLPEIIPDAADQLREQWRIKPDRAVIAFVSRLHPKKGLELLFEAISQLTSHPLSLIIAGDGDKDYIQQLKTMAEQLGIDKQIIWAGFTTGADRDLLLQGADLFVLTSYSENFGIAVLEALASGTPALVSKGVALAAQIKEHQLGFIADHTVQSIAETLVLALRKIDAPDNKPLSTMHATRKYVAEHYHWPQIAEHLNAVYQSLCEPMKYPDS